MKKTLIYVAFAGLTILSGCENETAPSLDLSPEYISAPDSTGQFITNVHASTAWTVTVDAGADWCSVFPPIGNCDGIIFVDVQDNPSFEIRRALINVAAGDITKQVVVSQNGKAQVLDAEPDTIRAQFTAGSYVLNVISNTVWVADPDPGADWLTLSSANGSGNGTIVVNVAENTDFTNRTANISLISGGLVYKTVAVEQELKRGMKIGNTIWAMCNLDEPGVFAETPGAYGKLYQFNSKTSGFDPSWDCPFDINTSSNKWMPENDPCPEGWRLPTVAEILPFENLMTQTIPSSFRRASSDNWDVDGIWFGTNASTAAASDPKGCIFLPLGGYIKADGTLVERGSVTAVGATQSANFGYYYSSSISSTSMAPYTGCAYIQLTFMGNKAYCYGLSVYVKAQAKIALSVRCVKQ